MRCQAIGQNGAQCSSGVVKENMQNSDLCSHHYQINRMLILAGSKPLLKTTVIPEPTTTYPPKISHSLPSPPTFLERLDKIQINGTKNDAIKQNLSQEHDNFLLGEEEIVKYPCSFDYIPIAYYYGEIMTIRPPQSLEGKLVLTNYRIQFIPDEMKRQDLYLSYQNKETSLNPNILKNAILGRPWSSINRIIHPLSLASSTFSGRSSNNNKALPTHISIIFKDLQEWSISGDAVYLLSSLKDRVFIHSSQCLFAFSNKSFIQTSENQKNHLVYDLKDDFLRQGLDLTNNQTYRMTSKNTDYSLCETYPQKFVVPWITSDTDLLAVADFRSKGRLPVLCWVHGNSASIWRSAQPKRGLFNSLSQPDSNMLAAIGRTNSNESNIWIVDCRPELNARANNLTGGGTESASLRHVTISFMDIDNIHVIRESYQSLRQTCFAVNGDHDMSWLTRIEDTKWLFHIRKILSASIKVANAVNDKAQTVLVHCSDGWDRTAQVCSLAQILLDPFYRTITGFTYIIEKEWLHMGHKFTDRIGAGFGENDERAPIFLQFIECCWQLYHQYSSWFEYNDYLLEFIVESTLSARFGTFLGNCDRERKLIYNLPERTLSIWTYIKENIKLFRNPTYRTDTIKLFPENVKDTNVPLLPSIASIVRSIVPWNHYHFKNIPIPSTAC